MVIEPKEFHGSNKVEKISVNKIKLGEPDDTGRRKPEIQNDGGFNLDVDMVIKSLRI